MTQTVPEAPTAAPPRVPNASTFGARLALVRQLMRWGNIAEAARECGLPTDSWRNWEVDGREPRRLVTIAMAIATRANVDIDWLVYGPSKPETVPNGRYPRDLADLAKPRIPTILGQRIIAPVVHGDGRRTPRRTSSRPAVTRPAGKAPTTVHRGRPVSRRELA